MIAWKSFFLFQNFTKNLEHTIFLVCKTVWCSPEGTPNSEETCLGLHRDNLEIFIQIQTDSNITTTTKGTNIQMTTKGERSMGMTTKEQMCVETKTSKRLQQSEMI